MVHQFLERCGPVFGHKTLDHAHLVGVVEPGRLGLLQKEALVLFGSVVVYLWAGIITFGIFITVGYILWMLNRIVFSDPDPEKEVTEAPWVDLIAPIIMMIPVILLGVWPDLVLDFTQSVVAFILGGVP